MKVEKLILALTAIQKLHPDSDVCVSRPFNVECGPGESNPIRSVTQHNNDPVIYLIMGQSE